MVDLYRAPAKVGAQALSSLKHGVVNKANQLLNLMGPVTHVSLFAVVSDADAGTNPGTFFLADRGHFVSLNSCSIRWKVLVLMVYAGICGGTSGGGCHEDVVTTPAAQKA